MILIAALRKGVMEGHQECKECELAVYCYSEISTWIFRTTREMEEKKILIDRCPVYRQMNYPDCSYRQ